MTHADFRDTLHLLDSAIALLHPGRTADPEAIRRQLRTLSLEFDLLRERLGRTTADVQRN
jgi:hypothetical protein